MPKKLPPKDHREEVSWIERLPEKGGTWGKGIVDTVSGLMDEADKADAEAAEFEKVAKEARDKATARRTLADQTARRAAREAPKLFTVEALARATGQTPVTAGNGEAKATA